MNGQGFYMKSFLFWFQRKALYVVRLDLDK